MIVIIVGDWDIASLLRFRYRSLQEKARSQVSYMTSKITVIFSDSIELVLLKLFLA